MSENTLESQKKLADGTSTVTNLDTNTALRAVIKQALVQRGLSRGLKECVKALDCNKKIAVLCVLASDCNESGYVSLIEALCRQKNIPLIRSVDKMTLGEMCGLCQINTDGEAIKISKCSCSVIRTEGAPSPEKPLFAFDCLMSSIS